MSTPLNADDNLKMANNKNIYEPTVSDLKLIQAVEEDDINEVIRALEEGANPNVRKKIRGLSQGESLILLCIRENKPEMLELLLEAGGSFNHSMVVASAMLMERSCRSPADGAIGKSLKILTILDKAGADWTATDRFIGGGLRAIDLIANVNGEWAKKIAKRLKIELDLFLAPEFPNPEYKPANTRQVTA